MSHQDFPVRDAMVRVFDRSTEPGADDASDMYVLEVFGVSVLIRRRSTGDGSRNDSELYVHIDNEDRAPTALAIEVSNRGETHYRL